MRTLSIVSGIFVGLLATYAAPADAATVTRVVTSGTTANLNLAVSLPGSRSDCTIDVLVILTAATSVQKSDNTTSTGAIGYVQRVDNCTDDFESGTFSVVLPATAFTTGTGTATLNTTIPVTLNSFPSGDAVNRTLVASLRYTAVENNSVASRSFSRFRAPGLTIISRGRSILNATAISGQLTLDGATLIKPAAAVDSGIETGNSATIEITK